MHVVRADVIHACIREGLVQAEPTHFGIVASGVVKFPSRQVAHGPPAPPSSFVSNAIPPAKSPPVALSNTSFTVSASSEPHGIASSAAWLTMNNWARRAAQLVILMSTYHNFT